MLHNTPTLCLTICLILCSACSPEIEGTSKPSAEPVLMASPRPIETARGPESIPATSAPVKTGTVVPDLAPEPEVEPLVKVVDSAIAQGVTRRVPEGIGHIFGTEAGTLTAWVAIDNPGDPTTITMVWRRDGEVRSTLRLDVGTSPRWRTWSRTRIRDFDVGQWNVEVYDAQGILVDTMEFTIRNLSDVG